MTALLLRLRSRRVHNAGVAGAVVIPDEDESPGAEVALDSAHEAAVAEGGARVRAEIAEEHAEQAESAAEVAIAAAEENAKTAQAVIEATAAAEGSAAEAKSLTEAIAEMHDAQMAAIHALGEELRASRETARPVMQEAKSKPERAPGGGRPRWTRR